MVIAASGGQDHKIWSVYFNYWLWEITIPGMLPVNPEGTPGVYKIM